MKYSTMTYTFTRQKDRYDMDRMLAFTARHMDGMDVVGLQDTPAEEWRQRADDLGIPIVCHTFFCGDLPSADPEKRRQGLDAAKRGIDAAVVLGAPVAMIPTMTHDDLDRAARRRAWIDGLSEAIGFAESAGIVLTVENFPGDRSPFVLASDFLEARAAIPGLQLTYDNGNAASGEDPAASFRACAPYVVHAHFKDWVVSDEPREGYRPMLDGRFYKAALIGEGAIPHAACLAAMREAGYSGYVNIEYEGNEYDPLDATRRAVEFLRGLEG